MNPEWWPWLTEGMVTFSGACFVFVFAVGLKLAQLDHANDERFRQAHRRGDVRRMHDFALYHRMIRRAIFFNQVTVAAAAVSFLVLLNLYVTAHPN